MSCNQGTALTLLMFFIAFIGLLPFYSLFKQYCERIAMLEGRTEECYSLKTDDGGMNQFEIEHWKKLGTRYYLNFDDEQLTTIGNKLLKWKITYLILIVAFIVSVIAVNSVACR